MKDFDINRITQAAVNGHVRSLKSFVFKTKLALLTATFRVTWRMAVCWLVAKYGLGFEPMPYLWHLLFLSSALIIWEETRIKDYYEAQIEKGLADFLETLKDESHKKTFEASKKGEGFQKTLDYIGLF